MGMVKFTIEIPEEKAAELAQIAAQNSESSEAMVARAVEDLVEDYRRFCERIDRADAEIDAGNFVTHDRVVAWLRTWGTEHEIDPP